MKTIIEKRPLSGIGENNLSAAWDDYRDGGPVLSSFDDALLRQVQITIDDGTEKPKFLYIGPENIAAQFYGKDFCHEAIGSGGLPDREFDDPLNWVYGEVAWTKEVSLDHVIGEVAGFYVQYNRLVLPIEGRDRMQFACFIQPERIAYVSSAEEDIIRIDGWRSWSGPLPAAAS